MINLRIAATALGLLTATQLLIACDRPVDLPRCWGSTDFPLGTSFEGRAVIVAASETPALMFPLECSPRGGAIALALPKGAQLQAMSAGGQPTELEGSHFYEGDVRGTISAQRWNGQPRAILDNVENVIGLDADAVLQRYD